MLHHGIAHFDGSADVNHGDAGRLRKLHWARHQSDPRATLGGSLGECVTHLSAGTVGDETHRVERLLGRACGDQHRLSLKILPLQAQASNNIGDSLRFGQAARAGCSASQQAFLRLDDQVAATL